MKLCSFSCGSLTGGLNNFLNLVLFPEQLHSFIALLVMACGNRVFGNYLVGALGFYLFVCVAGFLFSATVVFIGAMQLPEQNPTIPWAFMVG